MTCEGTFCDCLWRYMNKSVQSSWNTSKKKLRMFLTNTNFLSKGVYWSCLEKHTWEVNYRNLIILGQQHYLLRRTNPVWMSHKSESYGWASSLELSDKRSFILGELCPSYRQIHNRDSSSWATVCSRSLSNGEAFLSLVSFLSFLRLIRFGRFLYIMSNLSPSRKCFHLEEITTQQFYVFIAF